jgi:hypothetical protein
VLCSILHVFTEDIRRASTQAVYLGIRYLVVCDCNLGPCLHLVHPTSPSQSLIQFPPNNTLHGSRVIFIFNFYFSLVTALTIRSEKHLNGRLDLSFNWPFNRVPEIRSFTRAFDDLVPFGITHPPHSEFGKTTLPIHLSPYRHPFPN